MQEIHFFLGHPVGSDSELCNSLDAYHNVNDHEADFAYSGKGFDFGFSFSIAGWVCQRAGGTYPSIIRQVPPPLPPLHRKQASLKGNAGRKNVKLK